MSTGPKNSKPQKAETPAQKLKREAKDAEVRRARYRRAVGQVLLAYLAEQGGWSGGLPDLAEALTNAADEKQKANLPDVSEEDEFEVAINGARADLINLGWSFFPRNLSYKEKEVRFFRTPEHWQKTNTPHPYRMQDGPVVVDASGSAKADRTTEAVRYARSYRGSFPFMLKMRQAAQDPTWVPSNKQSAAILKCRSYAHAR